MSQNRNPEADATAGNKNIPQNEYTNELTKIICLFSLFSLRFSNSPEHKGLQLRTIVSGPRRYSRN